MGGKDLRGAQRGCGGKGETILGGGGGGVGGGGGGEGGGGKISGGEREKGVLGGKGEKIFRRKKILARKGSKRS